MEKLDESEADENEEKQRNSGRKATTEKEKAGEIAIVLVGLGRNENGYEGKVKGIRDFIGKLRRRDWIANGSPKLERIFAGSNLL